MVTAHRSFGQVELSQQHGPGRFQSRDDRGIEVRDVRRERPRPSHRADVPREAQILHGDRNPMERPAIRAGRDFLLGSAGRDHCLVRHHRDVALQAAVELPYARQQRRGDLHRR